MTQVLSQRAFCQVPDSPPQQDMSPTSKIFVQHDQAKDMLKISFEYIIDGKSKQFNLYRKAREHLAGSLERIRLNLLKISKSKKTKLATEVRGDQSHKELNLRFLLNDTTVDPNLTLNIDAWIEGATLELDGKLYEVKTDEPQVVSMKLPAPMMKGFVLLPGIELSNCQINNCHFTWYRRISANEREQLIRHDESLENSIELHETTYWYKLIESLTYCPVDEDIAHLLKVVCYPSDGKRWGLAYNCLSTTPVELGPKSCPFEKRHQLTKERFNLGPNFRLVTYNILADLYADSDYSRSVLFAHCPEYALDIDYRRQLLVKELHGYNADIICLQEVDKKEFIRTYKPFFQMISGHSGVFHNKGGQVAEGVAMFFREDKFELIDSHKITLAKLIDPASKTVSKDDSIPELIDAALESTINQNGSDPIKEGRVDQSDLRTHPILNNLGSPGSVELLSRFESIREKIMPHSPLKRRFLSLHTVLQTSLLQVKGLQQTYVIVANTHLYFAPDADHIRLLQGIVCVKYIEFIKEYYRKIIGQDHDSSHVKLSTVFCGDMNSSPDCGLFSLLQTGKVGSDLADWSSNKEEAIDGMEVDTPLRFKSAYQNIPYTNYTPGFNGCLDYIYYELNGISCESIVPLPDHDEVTAIQGLPSNVFPSDHLALIANLKFG